MMQMKLSVCLSVCLLLLSCNETQCKRERDFHNATKEEDEEEDEERRQITQLYLYKFFSSSEEQVDAAGRDRMKGSGTKWQRFKVLLQQKQQQQLCRR